jgi:CHAD domain-containing protein
MHMAYRFETDDSVRTSFQRVGGEQLDRAIGRLTDDVHDEPVDAIHDARKAIKKERSLLRLAAPALDRGQRRSVNAALRRTAHELGRAREADALLAALDGIAKRFAGQVPEATIDALRERLAADRDAERGALEQRGVPGRAADELQAIQPILRGLRVERGGWPAVSGGLRRSYRRGRRAMARAGNSSSPQLMHEWRKRAKDLWYHLRLLEPTLPGTMGGAAKDAHRLADLLGDLHDLAGLDAAVRERQTGVAADLDPVLGLIEHRTDQLREEAFSLGARVYAERPKAFLRRVRRYWKAAHAGASAAQAVQRPQALAEAARHPGMV